MARASAGIPPDTKGPGPQDEKARRNAEMIGQLDQFLDELAVGHRAAMDQVVAWLTTLGNLDAEIRKSVEALSPLLQRWSIEICFLLRMRQPRRFGELRDNLPGIGSRTPASASRSWSSRG